MKINQVKIGNHVTTSDEQNATIYIVVDIQSGGYVQIQEMISSNVARQPSPVWIDCSVLQNANIEQLFY